MASNYGYIFTAAIIVVAIPALFGLVGSYFGHSITQTGQEPAIIENLNNFLSIGGVSLPTFIENIFLGISIFPLWLNFSLFGVWGFMLVWGLIDILWIG